MEPISAGIIGMFIWENLGQPILEKAKDEYSGQVLGKLESALNRFSLKKKDLEILEAEIVAADNDVLTDKDKFLEYIKNNPKIQELITSLNQPIPQISIGEVTGVVVNYGTVTQNINTKS